MSATLKAPFPYFGGKTRTAPKVWSALGSVRNYIEPFAGSAAVLLGRPAPVRGSETLNDFSCALVNVWRAIAMQPERLTLDLVGPVSEVNTEAQHWELIGMEPHLRERLGDPTWCDIRLAAFWIRGANEWIGSGWCNADGPWSWTRDRGWSKRSRQLPHLGNAGTGINRQLPHLGNAGTGEYDLRCSFVHDWLSGLRDRLCNVRIACGSWERVLTNSVAEKHGLTGVYLDPPYDTTEYVYGDQTQLVSEDVRDWCLEKGQSKLFRIVLSGRGGEHDELLKHGWQKEQWKALRGYSNESNNGRHEESLWMSPHTLENDLV